MTQTRMSPARRHEHVLLMLTLACLAVACERGALGGDDDGCAALASEREKVAVLLGELEGSVKALPADAVRYPDKTREALQRLNGLLRSSNAQLDAMYDAHEVACKWPLIEQGDFEAVLEQVYLPHVELVTRQIGALQAAADKLEAGAPAEVTGEVVEGYRRTATLLEQGLREQILVCETDFGDASCRPYNEAIEAQLGAAATKEKTTKTTTDATSAGADGDADDPAQAAPAADATHKEEP